MLVVIIVSWNVRELLHACLSSLHANQATRHSQCIVVVDNASIDNSADMIRSEFPHVHLIANQTNRGFTGGNNDGIGAAEALFHNSEEDTSYVLLLNPDTRVLPGALDSMLDYADAHPDVGLMGPRLLYPDGNVQSSRRRFIDFPTALFESTWLQRYAPRRLLDSYYMRDVPDNEVCDVDWVYGAAMLVRRSTYRQCGLLDEASFFMYSEEMDWCKRIKGTPIPAGQSGISDSSRWRIVYFPSADVVHYEAQSSTQVSARRYIYFNTSKVRYFHKHHGAVQAEVLRFCLLAMYAQQTMLESLKWLTGHKRPLRAERIRAYLAVLHSGLR